MRIYLVRHGESVDDVEDCYGGIADFPLTESGRDTAHKLANELAGCGIEIIYSSPYKRATETAEFLASALNCDVKIVPDLRERNSYGVLSGVNKDRAKEIFGDVLRSVNKPGDYYSDELVVGAEPKGEFVTRVKNAFDAVVSDARDRKTIGIVTHGNVTRAFYEHILAVPGKVGLDLLAITELDFTPETIHIESQQGVSVKP